MYGDEDENEKWTRKVDEERAIKLVQEAGREKERIPISRTNRTVRTTSIVFILVSFEFSSQYDETWYYDLKLKLRGYAWKIAWTNKKMLI